MSISDSVNKFWNGSTWQKPQSAKAIQFKATYARFQEISNSWDQITNWLEENVENKTKEQSVSKAGCLGAIIHAGEIMDLLGNTLDGEIDSDSFDQTILEDLTLVIKSFLSIMYITALEFGFVFNEKDKDIYPSLYELSQYDNSQLSDLRNVARNQIEKLYAKYVTSKQSSLKSVDSKYNEKLILADENARAITYLNDWADGYRSGEIEGKEIGLSEIPEYESEYIKKVGVLGTRLMNKMDTKETTENMSDWILTQKASLVMLYNSLLLRGIEIDEKITAEYPSIEKMLVLYNQVPETALSEAHNTIDSLLKKYPY
jgi:hypothetical protein